MCINPGVSKLPDVPDADAVANAIWLLEVTCCAVLCVAALPCPIPIVLSECSSSGSKKSAGSSSRGGVGTLTGHVGNMGMAYIKLLPALAAAEGRTPPLQLQLEGHQVSVVPVRPHWWPTDWGREERAGSTNGAP